MSIFIYWFVYFLSVFIYMLCLRHKVKGGVGYTWIVSQFLSLLDDEKSTLMLSVASFTNKAIVIELANNVL